MIIAGYARVAADIIARYDEIEPEHLYKESALYFPSPPAAALDIGAGTGRDALWLAEMGFQVTAVEPVAALRDHGAGRDRRGKVSWIDDRLPKLQRLASTTDRFNLILVNAVWQHLPKEDQVEAIGTLTRLLGERGRIILSIRHGPGACDRKVYECDADHVVMEFERKSVSLLSRETRKSLQAANKANSVSWEWLALEKR